MVQAIDKLDDVLDQIEGGKEITIGDISASLELVKNKIKEDSYYRDHPQTEIFAIHEASLGLLKPGNSSAELFDMDREMLKELEDKYDNQFIETFILGRIL
ncbi:MAG TPA: hypothetical protein VHH33_08610 [Nitrososphaeraceae archaeon]|jgi:hypothetical protein|nr:hypothetical protein [Nitrososphaeraceae archaeon]